MGVPLIIQEKSIGCLSVFSYEEGFSFDEIDEILFSLVAAKVSSRLEISKLATTNAEYLERLYSKQQIETVVRFCKWGSDICGIFWLCLNHKPCISRNG